MATITTANCPSCGGPITFKVGSSIVVICEFCGSSIARTDRDLRNLGKIADLVDTQSPLRVGLEGRFDGRPFVLTGRVQIAHQAGGVWDEWYASFGDPYWGWLAEAQGRFYMTFPRQVPDGNAVPPVNYLQPGQRLAVPGDQTPYVVGETGVGRVISGQGEIPYAVQPGFTYAYADLSGPNGAFATLDYRTAPPVVFSGREVTLKEMGISAVVDEYDAEKRQIKVAKLACPQCAAPVELRAPDASLRVTCPSCNALLDVNQGNLTYLKTLEQTRQQRYPLGAEGTFDGVPLTVIGYVVRGCQVEGQWYYWEEYLLYNPQVGFTWLVNGEGGWYFVVNAPPGDVEVVSDARVRFHGKGFSLKEAVTAVVTYVRGEFYWRVEVGEQAAAADFVSGREMLSREISGSEVNWSFGRQVDPAALDQAFAPEPHRKRAMQLPAPRVVVPKKPLPSMWTALGVWVVMTLLAVVVWFGVKAMAQQRQLVSQTVSFAEETMPPRPPQPTAPDDDTEYSWSPSAVEQTAVVGSFEATGSRGLEVEVEAPAPFYTALYLKLVNDATGEVRTEGVSLSNNRYTGTFEAPTPGHYTLYAIRRWTESDKDLQVKVTLVEGKPDANLPVLFPILMLAGPGLLLFMKLVRAMFSE
jgi:hypothetical protein